MLIRRSYQTTVFPHKNLSEKISNFLNKKWYEIKKKWWGKNQTRWDKFTVITLFILKKVNDNLK